jgi:ATP-dependent Clp protease ATP-binding subunit ClpC
MYERFTNRARKVMQQANRQAQRFNHEYIGTEHILLGIVEEGSGSAVAILENLQIELPKVAQEVESTIRSGADMMSRGRLPQTPRAKKVIEYALEEARAFGHNSVGTEHLLLGLLRDKEGVADQVLMSLGVWPEDVRGEVAKLTEREPATAAPPGPWPSDAVAFQSGVRALGRLIGRAARAVRLGRFIGGHPPS